MWLQKKLNTWLIKKAIGSKYVYQIETEEAIKRWYIEGWKSKLTWFLKDGVEEMKKEVKKKLS
jgi:hypothetical protein